MFEAAIVVTLALLLDRWLGEPGRFHPLVGFGRAADRVEQILYRGGDGASRFCGVVGWAAMILPMLSLGLLLLMLEGGWQYLAEIAVLYLAVGGRSLVEHGEAVRSALQHDNLFDARKAVGKIVSRETGQLDSRQVSVAAVESLLENGSDALFAPLFWYLVAGIPGVLLYRGVNTLDAMWGYKNQRYIDFGWWSARADDWVNWVPARLTALSYAVVGSGRDAMRCWRHQAASCKSPNGGVVMAAGAGALQVQLGGVAYYQGQREQKPLLGCGDIADAIKIEQAIELLQRSQWLWIAILWLHVLVVG